MTKKPVTVLTGYLGAGKTTLLNHLLTQPTKIRYAVIVNEFGEIGIDNDLVIGADEEIFEMNNGCICCTVRGDLIRILGNLQKRQSKFDAIIIETTGLADPAPVAQTFFADDDVRSWTTLDAVVTVADAKFLEESLRTSLQARTQIAFADVVVLNKTDLVDAAQLVEVEQRIRTLNPFARVHKTTRSNIDPAAVLDCGAFDLARILDLQPDFLPDAPAHNHDHDHDHEHDHHHIDHLADIDSLSLTSVAPLSGDKFMAWVARVSEQHGAQLLRWKGILNFAGEPRRYVFQGVHMILDGDFQKPWTASDTQVSRMVFIGHDLPRAALAAGFAECTA